jgi:HPt (histidine-containing phosphotransfer) domain-containing protein
LLKFCSDDHEMFSEILQEYVYAISEDEKAINAALEVQDFEKIRDIVHRLSGRLGQMRIRYAAIAIQIEREIKNGKTVETVGLINSLVRETSQVMEKIQSEWMLKPAE